MALRRPGPRPRPLRRLRRPSRRQPARPSSDPEPGVAMRTATLQRATAETEVRLTLHLDGGEARIQTGLAYFDHMLMQLAKHGGFGLIIEAKGDLPVDSHHLVGTVGHSVG